MCQDQIHKLKNITVSTTANASLPYTPEHTHSDKTKGGICQTVSEVNKVFLNPLAKSASDSVRESSLRLLPHTDATIVSA